MRPIRDIADVHPDNVLYHSAFGFARVAGIGPGFVRLDWAETADNLPSRVSNGNLTRVYALCAPGGFFDRTVHDRDELLEELHVTPLDALAQLLRDLSGPQRRRDLREWMVRRELMTETTFDRWWDGLAGELAEDERFVATGRGIELNDPVAPSEPHARLERPGLSPARRLDLALAHRTEIDPEVYLHHVLRAWADGGAQVRDLALAATRDVAPDTILRGFLALETDGVDGLIHALRRGGWEPADVSSPVRQALVERVVSGCARGGPLDAEGRLTAVLYRWGASEVLSAIAPLVGGPDGQQLVRATLATLPQRRGEELGLDLLQRVSQRDATSIAAQWLGQELLRRGEVDDGDALAERITEDFPQAAVWYRVAYDPELHAEPLVGDAADADLSFDEPQGPVRWSDMPPRLASGFLNTAVTLARALAEHHGRGVTAVPMHNTVFVQPDGSVRIEADSRRDPRLFGEKPDPRTDLHAAGILLVESLLGRRWPRHVPVARVLPYLRLIAPDLPAAAIHILDIAVHPDPGHRPVDAREWLRTIQSAIEADERRAMGATSGTRGLDVGYDTHVGYGKLLLTQTNQDALFVSAAGDMRLLVVCDGISTATAGSGDVASGIAVQVVANLWEQALPRLREAPGSEIDDFMNRALRVANQAVCEAALRFAGGRLDGQVPMGTTTVMAITRGADVWLAWLGDSRAYLVGDGSASLVTADQNQAGDRLRAWQAGIDGDWDPAGYALVGYIGHFNDFHSAEPLPASRYHTRLLPGERLVLCSDGVSDYIADNHPSVAARVAHAASQGDCDTIARRLVRLANEAGGGDNCTVIVAARL